MELGFSLIIDFDHTLFDTNAFLAAAQSIAKQHGITKTQFYRTFTAITDERDDAAYNFAEHVKTLSTLTTINEQELLAELSAIVLKSSRFLYSDSISFLKKIRKWNVHVHLVTFADADMREQQLAKSGIKKQIDYTHIISTSRDEKISTKKK